MQARIASNSSLTRLQELGPLAARLGEPDGRGSGPPMQETRRTRRRDEVTALSIKWGSPAVAQPFCMP